MLKSIITYLTEGSVYAGLEIYGSHGTENYCYLELEKRNNELSIQEGKRSDNLEGTISTIKKDVPLFLTINTGNVLTRQLHGSGTLDPEALVNEAFPNLDLDNFYYGVSQMSKDPIVTISKKEYVDGLIKELGKMEQHLIGFSLGSTSFTNILSFVEDGDLSVSNVKLTVEQGSITKMTPHEDTGEQLYTINGLEIPHFSLLSFSHIYGHLAGYPSYSNFRERSDGLRSNFNNARFFNITLKFSLVFFLALLMANFLIFGHYHDQIGNLKNLAAINISDGDILKDLEVQVADKQQRVELLSAGTGSRATYYLDEIGKGVPAGILLDQIIYLPLAKPLRDSRPIEQDGNTILVKGISRDDSSYSSWLGTLEKNTWIAIVETMDYDYLTRESSEFLFKITLHEDQ